MSSSKVHDESSLMGNEQQKLHNDTSGLRGSPDIGPVSRENPEEEEKQAPIQKRESKINDLSHNP